MLTVLLVHAANEYLLQPERWIVAKREFKPVGPIFMLLHIAPPALLCWALGAADVRGALILMTMHALADGPVAKIILRRLPSQNVLKALEHDYGQWPLQVHALHLALAANSEQNAWAVFHALALAAAMSLGALSPVLP